MPYLRQPPSGCCAGEMNGRPYQLRALQALRAAWKAGKRRVLMVAPTGAGKTWIAGEAIRMTVERGGKVLAIAHRGELLGQLSDRLTAARVFHGVMMGRHPLHAPLAPVQVASVDTLRSRGIPFQPTLLVIDEAHRTQAKTYREIIQWCGPDVFILGLTATPQRTDGQGLGDTYEVMIVVATPQELVDAGFLVAPRLHAPGVPDMVGAKKAGGDYTGADSAARMAPLTGDIIATWKANARELRTLVFASSVAHRAVPSRRCARAPRGRPHAKSARGVEAFRPRRA